MGSYKKRKHHRKISNLQAKGTVIAKKINESVSMILGNPWSLLPLILLIFGLGMLCYLQSGLHYLTSEKPLLMNDCMQLYLIDLSVGFISRALIGTILSWFSPKISFALVLQLCRAFVILALFLQAILTGIVLRKAWLKQDFIVVVFCNIISVSPVTVLSNISNIGLLDIFNTVLLMLYFFVSDKKTTIFITPLFCFLCLLIHYQFAIIFFPTVVINQYYYLCKEKSFYRIRKAFLIITCVVTLFSTIYFVFLSKYTVKLSSQEIYDYICSKYEDIESGGILEGYFDYYIFGEYKGQDFSNPFKFLSFLINYALTSIHLKPLLLISLYFVPIHGLLIYFWHSIYLKAEKGRKYSYLALLLHPFLLIIAFILSSDTLRWVYASVISHILLFFAVYRSDDPLMNDLMAQLRKKLNSRNKRKKIIVFCLIYTCFTIALAHFI